MNSQKITGLLELIDSYNTELFKAIPASSREQYISVRRYTAAFLSAAYGKKEISLQNADEKLLDCFSRFMLSHGYSQRTAHRNTGLLRRIIGSVNKDGVLVGSIATRKYAARHEYLTEEELIRLLIIQLPNERLQRVRDIFVFSCFTGLRHDDLRGLTSANLTECGDGRASLVIGRKMTGIISYIPLLDIPRRIIDKYRDRDEESLLPCITSEKTNYYLKQIDRAYGLDKNLCFTMARNTFAGTVAFAHGLPTDSIARVMGDHANTAFETMVLKDQEKIEAEFTALEGRLEKYTDVFVI